MKILGFVLIGLAAITIVIGLIYPRVNNKKISWEAQTSLVAAGLFAYSALFLGLGTWFYTMGEAVEARKVQQQALLDALAVDIRRGADACLGHMDISRKLLPGQGRVIGLVPQV